MSEPENFLARWSRRKLEPEHEPKKESPAPEKPEIDDAAEKQTVACSPGDAEAAPEFDLTQLPPLESIGPETDVTAFLKPGVPSDLRHAALRRAWAADPAIRDFRNLQEMDWDFENPSSIPGFGPLDPGTDVKKMVEALFGEGPAKQETPASDTANEPEVAALPQQTVAPPESRGAPGEAEADSPAADPSAEPPAVVRREEDIASQNKNLESDSPNRPRSHGGALPS